MYATDVKSRINATFNKGSFSLWEGVVKVPSPCRERVRVRGLNRIIA
jgi:hypothetical protein